MCMVTAVSRLIDQMSSRIIGIPKQIIIHQLPHNSIQRASPDSSYESTCWLLSGSEQDNSQQMDGIYWLADKCLYIEHCEGGDCVFGSLITCSMNPETAVTFTHGHNNQVDLQCA